MEEVDDGGYNGATAEEVAGEGNSLACWHWKSLLAVPAV